MVTTIKFGVNVEIARQLEKGIKRYINVDYFVLTKSVQDGKANIYL